MNPFRIVVLLFALCMAVGCSDQSSQTPVPRSDIELSQAPSTQQYPRYQIIFSPHLRADTFLLDTQKGRVWQMTKITDLPGQPSAWLETDIIDAQGEIGMTFSEFKKQYVAPESGVGKNRKAP